MDAIRLRNYRCFEDTNWVNLKHINLLVGANSSGKSSFLKFFPLLKQSTRIRLHGVFKWLGNDVDFKDFYNTVQDGKDEMIIDYKVDNLPIYQRFSGSLKYLPNVNVSFTIASIDKHFDMVKCLNVSYSGTDIHVEYGNNNDVVLLVNGLSSDSFQGLKVESVNVDATYPRLLFKYKNDTQGKDLVSNFLRQKLINEAKTLGGRFCESSKLMFFERIPLSYENFKKGVDGISKQDVDEAKALNLYRLCLLYNINQLIDSLNIHLIKLASHIVYVKPIRATIERYYRFQNLDLEDIDPDGSNLPMYLYNLGSNLLDAFNEWLNIHFKFKVQIKSSEGHIELLVVEEGKSARNTVDLGFGYTQLLPILAILWKTVFLDLENPEKITKPSEHIIVVEQPELHLHPRFQGVVAEMLATLASLAVSKNLNLRIIVETHSEIILNKLGEYVEAKNLNQDDVNVLMMEQNDKGISSIRSTRYSEEGYLEDWPRNFMEDVDKDR